MRFAALLLVAATTAAHADAFDDALAKHEYKLELKDGALAGPGADILKAAIDSANFVGLGEDHGIAQIPAFDAAVCKELAPHGFKHLALEVGPSVAAELEADAKAEGGAKRLAAFDKANPETVAFYTWREEFDFLRACPLHVYGIDQELMGSPVYVLPKVLATKPGPKATAALQQLIKEEATAHAAAAKSGSFGDLWLMSAKQATLDAAKTALAADGSAEAQKLFASLLESRDIYLGQGSKDTAYASNRHRAKLMKGLLLDDIGAAAKADGAFPKMIVKLGGYHLYRGNNPLRSSEVGNMIGEAAEAHRVDAVNILVLGLHGQQLAMVGPGKPAQPQKLDFVHDPDWKFMAPLARDAEKLGAYSLFDLRALRPAFGSLKVGDAELERLVFGYDFVVIVRDPTASHPLL